MGSMNHDGHDGMGATPEMTMDHTGMDPTMDHSQMGGGSHHGGVAFFHLSYDSVILFMQWATSDWKTMLYACIGAAVVAVLYEGLKFLREYLLRVTRRRSTYTKSCCSGFCTGMHILQTFLHIVQVAVSYALMLVFMTFNGWLCIAVLAGAGVGYLVFGWKRHTLDGEDHCN